MDSATASAESTSKIPPPDDRQLDAGEALQFLTSEMSREGEGEDEEAKIQKALDCPCLDEVRNGACGTPFLEAFSCFLRSKEEEKGSDCINEFLKMQACIEAHPEVYTPEEELEADNKAGA